MTQMVLDSYIWDDFRGFLRDIEFDDRTFAMDAFRGVGHGNSFLSSPHTVRNFRKELFDFDPKKLMLERTYSDAMLPDLHKEVKRLLGDAVCEPLEREVSEMGEAILKEYAKDGSAQP